MSDYEEGQRQALAVRERFARVMESVRRGYEVEPDHATEEGAG